jgi:cytokinin dehydrogenase
MERRHFLTTVLAGAAVVAFDPLGRGWVTAAEAAPPGAVAVPDLDGELTTDPAALAEVADDFGHIVHRTPRAVLRPGSVADVVALVRYANRHRIPVAMRGQGHSQFGQSQVGGGVVIDSRTLARIHDIRSDRVVVDPGVLWYDLAVATLAHGRTAPVYTDYVGLSVGGTLNTGGIGGATQRYGLQVDTVLELDVVTGAGDLVTCSRTRNRALFESVLGSLGQFAIIVRATIRLVPAPAYARGYHLFYRDLDPYLADQQAALRAGRFSSLEGSVQRTAADDGWEFFIDSAVYYTATPPDDAAVTRGLRPDRTEVAEYGFLEWVDRLRPTVEFLKSIGAWELPHPWLDLFLPAGRTAAVVAPTLAGLTTADTGQGPILLYPFRTGRVRARFVELPAEPVAFLFSVLRTTVPPVTVEAQLADNRVLYDRAVAAGGKRYPTGAVELTRADWRRHYGRDYPAFAAAKATWDPRRILTPGPDIVG